MIFLYILAYFLIGAIIDTFFEIILMQYNKTAFSTEGRIAVTLTWPFWFALFMLSLISDILNNFTHSLYDKLDKITDRMTKK